MPEHIPPILNTFDFVSPVIFSVLFICGMSFVPEPQRQRVNAVLVIGASAAYFSSGLGLWEQAFTTVATCVAYFGIRNYKFIGAAWLLHAVWDLLHHFYAAPILLFAPTSSFGCAIFDPLIACWFFFGAPPLTRLWSRFGAQAVL